MQKSLCRFPSLLKRQGNYAKGRLNGNLYNYYPKDSVEVVYYKNGVPAKKAGSFFNKLFSHKSHKTDTLKAVRQ